MNNKLLLSGIAFLTISFSGYCQTFYQKIYGDVSTNKAFSVISLTNGDFVISGQTGSTSATKDVFLMRTDSLGNMVWTKSYGTAQSEEGRVCKQTPDGGFIISGYSSSTNVDAALIKTDANGVLQWSKKYGGTGNDFAWPLDITNTGEIYFAGWSSSTIYGGLFDAFIVKTNNTGDTLWTKMFGSASEDYFRGLAATSDGGCIAVGETNGWSSNYDVIVVKLNSSGVTMWTKILGTVADVDYAWTVKQTSDGGYIIGGNSGVNSAKGDVLLIKLDASGNIEWSKMIGDGNVALNTCRSIIQTSNGNYLMSGYTGIGGGNEEGLLMMLDNIGNTIWSKQYAVGDSIEHIRFINEVTPNKYIAVGYTKDLVSAVGDYDVYFLQINNNGFSGGCNESTITYSNSTHTLPTISGAPSSSTNFTTSIISGSTTLVYSQNNLCDSTLFTSINENNFVESEYFRVYPNPATEELTLEFFKNHIYSGQIKIFNSIGELFREISIASSIEINITDLPNGLYFIQLDSYPQQTIKFIKQ
jgi:hypothetical protein